MPIINPTLPPATRDAIAQAELDKIALAHGLIVEQDIHKNVLRITDPANSVTYVAYFQARQRGNQSDEVQQITDDKVQIMCDNAATDPDQPIPAILNVRITDNGTRVMTVLATIPEWRQVAQRGTLISYTTTSGGTYAVNFNHLASAMSGTLPTNVVLAADTRTTIR